MEDINMFPVGVAMVTLILILFMFLCYSTHEYKQCMDKFCENKKGIYIVDECRRCSNLTVNCSLPYPHGVEGDSCI